MVTEKLEWQTPEMVELPVNAAESGFTEPTLADTDTYNS